MNSPIATESQSSLRTTRPSRSRSNEFVAVIKTPCVAGTETNHTNRLIQQAKLINCDKSHFHSGFVISLREKRRTRAVSA
jgi:hypothetical protein